VKTSSAGAPPVSAGAIVMAVGIFGTAALQQIPGFGAVLTRPLAITVALVWAALALAYIRAAVMGLMNGVFARPEVFAVGTWVAGTSVVASMEKLAFPNWRGLTAGLAAVAIAIMAYYAPLIGGGFRALVSSRGRSHATGIVLLSTVAIQAAGLAVPDLLAAEPAWLADSFLCLGLLCYLLGVSLIVQRYWRQPGWTLAEDWTNTNCILHGAISITGLAAVSSGTVGADACRAAWVYAGSVFVVVEAIEIARLAQRIRRYGWRRGAFTYDVSQWARNFTFGMFYAFTLALIGQFGAGPGWLGPVQDAVVAGGQYVVALLLLIEVALFAWHLFPATSTGKGAIM
jgi:hypothetical protein